MRQIKLNFRIIEHTADIGIEVEAESLEALLENAAAAMVSIISSKTAKPRKSVSISIDADDLEALMYSWLNEILFIVFSRNLLPSTFRVRSASPNRLEAEILGDSFKPEKRALEAEIKGATFHNMYVSEESGVWNARVIFDV